VLAAAGVALAILGGRAFEFGAHVVSEGLAGAASMGDPMGSLGWAIRAALFVVAPFGLLLTMAAIAANLAQTGWTPRPSAAAPDLTRVTAGWRGIFGSGFGARAGFAALQIATVAAIVAWTVWEGREGWSAAASEGPAAVGAWAGSAAGSLFVRCVVALLFVGVLDHLLLRARIERELALTPAEAIAEARDAEGDPAIRRRRSARHRELSAAGRLRDGAWIVSDGDRLAVVLTGEGSVVAVAGAGFARTLMGAARTRGTRVVPRPELARALAARVRPGGRVPEDLRSRLREARVAA